MKPGGERAGGGQRQLNTSLAEGGKRVSNPENTMLSVPSLPNSWMVAKVGRKWLFHGALYCNWFTNTLIGVKIHLDVSKKKKKKIHAHPQGTGLEIWGDFSGF